MDIQTEAILSVDNRVEIDFKSVLLQIQEKLSQNQSLINIENSKSQEEQQAIFGLIYMYEETELYARKLGFYFKYTGNTVNEKKEFKFNLLNNKTEEGYATNRIRENNVDYRKSLNDDLNNVLSKLRKDLSKKANEIEKALKSETVDSVTSKIYMYEETEIYCKQYGFIMNFTGRMSDGKKELEVDLSKAREKTLAQSFLKPYKSYYKLY